MTDEEALNLYEQMVEYFGFMPSPIHEPIRFAHYVKIYRYYKERKND